METEYCCCISLLVVVSSSPSELVVPDESMYFFDLRRVRLALVGNIASDNKEFNSDFDTLAVGDDDLLVLFEEDDV